MMEEFNHDVKGSRNDDDSDSEAGDVGESDFVELVPADVVTADALKERARQTSEAADVTATESSSAPSETSVDAPSSTSSNLSITRGRRALRATISPWPCRRHFRLLR